eukprot:6177989-Pleurochrysis_carterae.AAC.7
MEDFIDLFALLNPALTRFRESRFAHYLRQSESSALNHKPTPTIDLPSTIMRLHEPIWDRLQSSYDDVEAKIEVICEHRMHKLSSVIFVGCDGAGYSRMIHKLSQTRHFIL